MHSPRSPNSRGQLTLLPLSQSITTQFVTQSECPSRVAIGKLSDKVLLNIFRYYLDASPQFWSRLVHTCRRWRRIVFTSSRALRLRLFCTHRKPVLMTLGYWPTLPIVVWYGGYLGLDPPAPEDESNIIAALKQSDRVRSISLTVTSSLLEKLSAIERPFEELEDLVLLPGDGVRITLPNTFGWCPRLRSLHLTRIAFPALLQLLYSSRNLVDLQLYEGLYPWQLSPEALPNALSGMAQLRSLSLRILHAPYYLAPPPQSRERFVLPALRRLNFRGTTEYLEGLVARIDGPRLGNIEVTFFNNDFDLSKLSEFIDRIEMHKSHRQAHILSSEHAISISLIRSGFPTCLKLKLFCEPLNKQLSSLARICVHCSTFFSNVEDLRINVVRPQRQVDSGQWLEIIKPFTSVKWFRLDGNHSTSIVRDLQLPSRRRETVLPTLYKLCIPQPGPAHAPLEEAVVSFMTPRRLSGDPIAVECERLCHTSELRGTGSFSQVTIGTLSDGVLLKIFRHHLDTSPRSWPDLAHVCQGWRQIVFASPLGLDLRLYCTYGTPVSKTLDCWPYLPIIVQYGGFPNLDPPAPEDDDNIIVALKQSGRVSSISLTVTSSLLEKLSVISEPFSELEELDLQSPNNMQLTLPSTFRFGPRLRTLHSIRMAFPSFPQLLSPCSGLVGLQLHEIPSGGYFSPEAFANALSGMTHLQTLSLHFLSLPPRRNYLSLPPPPGERVVLPALMLLKYRGTSKYLDSLVARIDTPVLGDIDITFFSQPTIDASGLGRFIERIEMQTSLSQAKVQTSGHAISISFTNSGTFTPFRLQISCKQLDWQLSSMAQVCGQFFPFLFRVGNLGINTTQPSSGQDDVDGEQWLELIRAFGGVTDFQVADELTTTILCALGLADGGHATVLPALRYLHVDNPMAVNEPSWDALQLFITSRSLSGRPVQVNVPLHQCHICHAGFRQQQGLELHVKKHTYRIVCSYCDFECTVGHNDLFRTHLARTHPEVALDDELVSNPPSTRLPLQLDHFVNRHSSLRAPDIVAPSTMVAASHHQ